MAAKAYRSAFGRYDLVAGLIGQGAKARAFLRGAPQGSGIVDEAEGPSVEVAVEALRRKLIDRDSERLASRRRHPGHSSLAIPRPEEYRDALRVLQPTPAQWAMLRFHAAAGLRGATATELANVAGFPTYSSANLQYGLLGNQVASELGMTLPTYSRDPEREVSTWALAYEGPRAETDQFVWVMHPELVEALELL